MSGIVVVNIGWCLVGWCAEAMAEASRRQVEREAAAAASMSSSVKMLPTETIASLDSLPDAPPPTPAAGEIVASSVPAVPVPGPLMPPNMMPPHMIPGIWQSPR